MSKEEVLLDEKSKDIGILSDLSLEGIRNPRDLVQTIGERVSKLIEEHSMNFEGKIHICEASRKELSDITRRDVGYDISRAARKEISNIDIVELSIFKKYNIFEREFVNILPRFVYRGIDYLEPEHREIILKGIKTLLKNKVKIPHPKKDTIFILYKELKERGYKFSLLERIKISFFAF